MELSTSSQKSHSRCSVDRFVPHRKRWHTFASLFTVLSLFCVKVTCSSLCFIKVWVLYTIPNVCEQHDGHILCLHMCMGSSSCQVPLVLCYCSEQWCWSRLFVPKNSLDGGTALEVSELSVLFLHRSSNEEKWYNFSCGLKRY